MHAQSWILDGEIVALNSEGLSVFQLLQPRIHARSAGAASKLSRSQPAIYYAFDLLFLNGHDLRTETLDVRRRLLHEVLRPQGAIALTDWVDSEGEQLFALAVARGAEGIWPNARTAAMCRNAVATG